MPADNGSTSPGKNEDPKYQRIKHILEPDHVAEDDAHVDLREIDRAGGAPATPREHLPGPELESPHLDHEDEAAENVRIVEADLADEDGRWDPPSHEQEHPEADDEFGDLADFFPPGDDEDMEEMQDNRMMDTLMLLGVKERDAVSHIHAMNSNKAAATFSEVYGGGAIVECVNKARRDLNVQAFALWTSER